MKHEKERQIKEEQHNKNLLQKKESLINKKEKENELLKKNYENLLSNPQTIGNFINKIKIRVKRLQNDKLK